MTVHSKKVCKICGNPFTISQKDAENMLNLGFPLPERCKPCNNMKNDVKVLQCNACKAPFEYSAMEEYLLKKKFGEHFNPPHKCKSCRAKARINKH